MSHTKNLPRRLLVLVLCLALLTPPPASAADLYFTSINDNLLPLTADTMPVWSGNVLYVPYTVFDGNYTGIKLGLNCSRSSTSVTLYNLRQMLVFDLTSGTSRDEMTGATFSARAIIRNNRPYLPLKTVCSFFGLGYSYTDIAQGHLVRIKSDAVVLSDAKFIDAAGDLINRRLREYNLSLAPPAEPAPPPVPQPVPDDQLTSSVPTYLAFRCETRDGIPEILNALDHNACHALFFFTPQLMEEDPDLVRRILVSGHSVGLLAEGGSTEQTRDILAQGKHLMEQTTHMRPTLSSVPKDQRAALEEDGWVCWNETLSLSPSASVGAGTFASNTLRRLEGRTRTTCLTMEGSSDTGRVLSVLLRQLNAKKFVVSIPMETRL